MALAGTTSPSVILFRLRDQTPRSVTPKLLLVLAECVEALSTGAYRIRRLPIQPPRRII